MIWTFVIATYFVAAAVLGVFGRRMGAAATAVATVPFTVHLAEVVTVVARGADLPMVERLDWVPSLGLSIGFEVGPLNLLLSALVAGIGLGIVVFSRQYFGPGPRVVRFLALISLFTGGMAGIVSSDELFGLFLFWEVTTVASYLLIAFDHERAGARSSALQAVLVTAAGGLAMLAGFVVLALESGSTSIAEIVALPPSGPVASIALVLVLIGAFTKSAQFPFHFWLPGAMAAPTPASAFLHSATMVKAGVVLLVLLAPAFAADPVWQPIVLTIGLGTMALGAVAAASQRDLKLLLAYGTVSQLGFMTALIGLDLVAAAVAVLVAHALFKAGLFLVVGVIDQSSGTRDIFRLSGLYREKPGLAAISMLLTLSMAGAPPLLGFVTKEAAFDALVAQGAWLAMVVAGAASVMTVVYSVRFWWGAFGTKPGLPPTRARLGFAPMAIVPASLAVTSLGVGVAPGWLGDVIATATDQSVKLVLWPGLTTALLVSAVVLVVGSGAARVVSTRTGWSWRAPTLSSAYATSLRWLNRTADRVTGVVQNGSLPVYLAVILTTVVGAPGVVWAMNWEGGISIPGANGAAEAVLGAIAAVAALAATRTKRRLAAVLLLGLVGYAVAGLYVAFGAPDLALTQILVETLTVAIFALVLAKLPRRFGAEPASLSRRIRIMVAVTVGAFATLAAILITSVSPARNVASSYVENAVEAGGTNVVNVILTNFRALDTLGEITVLVGATLGISALVSARRSKVATAKPQTHAGARS